MANYRKEYRIKRRTKLERICAVGQGICGVIAAIAFASIGTVVKMSDYEMTPVLKIIGIMLLCGIVALILGIIRAVPRSRRALFDLSHKQAAAYQEETYVLDKQMRDAALKEYERRKSGKPLPDNSYPLSGKRR